MGVWILFILATILGLYTFRDTLFVLLLCIGGCVVFFGALLLMGA